MCTDGVHALQLASHGILPVWGITKQLDYTRVFWSNLKNEQDYFQLVFFFSELLYFKSLAFFVCTGQSLCGVHVFKKKKQTWYL